MCLGVTPLLLPVKVQPYRQAEQQDPKHTQQGLDFLNDFRTVIRKAASPQTQPFSSIAVLRRGVDGET